MSPESILQSLCSSSVHTSQKRKRLQKPPPLTHPASQIPSFSISEPSSSSTSTSSNTSLISRGNLTKLLLPTESSCPSPPPRSVTQEHPARPRSEPEHEPEDEGEDEEENCVVYEDDLVDGVVPDVDRGEVCIVLEIGIARAVRMWRVGSEIGLAR